MLNHFPWETRFILDIPQIDEQHEELIRRVNNLAITYNSEETRENVRNTILFLEEYVLTHFSTEEAFMNQSGYPALDEHHSIHENYTAQVNRLVFSIHGQDLTPELIAEANTLLVNWLSHHIDEEDRKFADWFHQHIKNSV